MRCAFVGWLFAVSSGDAVGAIVFAGFVGVALVFGVLGRRSRMGGRWCALLPLTLWSGCNVAPARVDVLAFAALVLMVAVATAYSAGRYLGRRAGVETMPDAWRRTANDGRA